MCVYKVMEAGGYGQALAQIPADSEGVHVGWS